MKWFSTGKKRAISFREKTLPEIKAIARILVVDDNESYIKSILENEGWKVKHQKDLESYSDPDLMDSHVICLDIIGVGAKLNCSSGIELINGIKEKYPAKRIILYSSVRTHDIFHSSLSMVDRKLFRDGQTFPFIKAVEELATEALNWNRCVEAIYEKFKENFGKEISKQEFEEKMLACVDSDRNISLDKILETLSSGTKIAKTIVAYLNEAKKEN